MDPDNKPADEAAETDETQNDQAFAEAWAEGSPTAKATDANDQEDADDQAATVEDKATPVKSQGDDGSADAEGAEDNQEKKPEDKPADTLADPDKAKTETMRWQGRARKAREEAEAEEARLAELKAKAEEKPVDDMTEEERTAIEEARKDYPDIDKLIDAKVKAALKNDVPRVVQEAAAPIARRIDTNEAKAHIREIATAHPDYADVANGDEFKEWLNRGLTYEEGARYRDIIKSGSAHEVVGMLTSFKESKAKPQGRFSQDPKRREQLEAAAAVRHRSTGIPKKGAAKDDYDGAWDEAKKRSG